MAGISGIRTNRRKVKLSETIRAYHGTGGEHHRYRSWEHCYRYFQTAGPRGLLADPKHAALQLAFYLASWGMYRGSSFLLQFAYTIHMPLIRTITAKRFSDLWRIDMGSDPSHSEMMPIVLELMNDVRETYRPFADENESGLPSDTLVTKIILGTFGCVPACDQFFLVGIKLHGMKYSAVNEFFLDRMLEFCRGNLKGLQREQRRIAERSGLNYPLMKLIDMHFWQWGFEHENAERA